MIVNEFLDEVKGFICEHKILCILTLGLAIVGFCVGRLGGREIIPLQQGFGLAGKADSASQAALRQVLAQSDVITTHQSSALTADKVILGQNQDKLSLPELLLVEKPAIKVDTKEKKDLSLKESKQAKALVTSLMQNNFNLFNDLLQKCSSINPTTPEGMIIIIFAMGRDDHKMLNVVLSKIKNNEENAPILEVINNFVQYRQVENPSPFEDSQPLNAFVETIIRYRPPAEYGSLFVKFRKEIVTSFARAWFERVPKEQQANAKDYLKLFDRDRYNLDIHSSLPSSPRFPWELVELKSLTIKSSSKIELPLEFANLPKLKELSIEEANNCTIPALPPSLSELTVSNTYPDLETIPPVEVLKVVDTETFSNVHVQKLCRVHPETGIALVLKQSKEIPSEIGQIGEKIVDIIYSNFDVIESFNFPSQISSLVKMDTLKRRHIHNTILWLFLNELFKIRGFYGYRGLRIEKFDLFIENFYHYVDLYEKDPQEFKNFILQEFKKDPRLLKYWLEKFMADPQQAKNFRFQPLNKIKLKELVETKNTFLQKYPEWKDWIDQEFADNPEKTIKLFLQRLPKFEKWIEGIFDNLAHLREWIKAPEGYSDRNIPKNTVHLPLGTIPCHRQYETKEVKEELVEALALEFKQQQKKGEATIKTDTGAYEPVKGYSRVDINFSVSPTLYHQFFQAYLMTYATHPERGDEWQRHVLTAMVEIFMSTDSVKLLDEEEQRQVRKAFIEGKIWVNEDDWYKRGFVEINIKTAWYQTNQDVFPVVEKKLTRSLQIWYRGFS